MINCTVGEMRNRIKFQTAVTETDDAGQVNIVSYTDVAAVWAKIKPLKSDEQKRGEGIELQGTHLITVRYRAGLDSTMTIKCGDDRYSITGIIDVDSLHIQLDVYATKVTSQ